MVDNFMHVNVYFPFCDSSACFQFFKSLKLYWRDKRQTKTNDALN